MLIEAKPPSAPKMLARVWTQSPVVLELTAEMVTGFLAKTGFIKLKLTVCGVPALTVWSVATVSRTVPESAVKVALLPKKAASSPERARGPEPVVERVNPERVTVSPETKSE